MSAAVAALGLALCSAAAAYALLALLAVLRATRVPHGGAATRLPVSVLKPLHGAEPQLHANLRSFCVQDYPTFQLLLGVRDDADPALAIARRIQAEFPQLDIGVVVDPHLHGRSHKVSNLINLLQHARHPWLVLADSDISVGPDYLQRVCAPLARPPVGIVTCLYRGHALGGLWARLGVMYIDEWFAPAVRIAQWFRSQAFGFGATLALRRDTLDAIGGLQRIADELADDYWLAEHTRRLGLRTVLSDYVVTTDVPEASASQLVEHELRWMGTIRLLNPAGYAFMFVSCGLSVAVLGAVLAGGSTAALALLGVTCIARAALHFAVARRDAHWPARALRRLPLVALRDVLTLLLWGGVYARRSVTLTERQLNSKHGV